MKNLGCIIVVFIFVFSGNSLAQRQDFQSWWQFEVSGELFNLIDFEVSPEMRFNNNSSSFRSMHSDFDLSVPISKYFRFGSNYRLQQKYLQNNSYLINRFGTYGKLDYKVRRFRIDYRAMYQWEFVGVNTRELGQVPYQEHRHKLSASYYRKRWDLRPKISSEFFFLHKPDFILSSKKYRISMSLSYRINKNLDWDISYKYQNEFYETNPLQAHIVAMRFSYGL
jgi:hypothetical protein